MKKRVVQDRGSGTRSDGGRKLEHYDAQTGEVMDGQIMFVPNRGKSPFGKDWFAMAQDAMMFLAKNRKALGEEGFAVFCALGARLDFENFILINQSQMARELKMDRSNFNKAIKKLEAHGILARGPKSGVSPTFKLNPKMAWKGRQKNHSRALDEAKKMGWDLVEGGNKELPDPNQLGLPFDV